MQNKNLKNWILGSVMTLMIVGGAASYLAQSQKLFLGLEPLDLSQAQASVLTADEEVNPDVTLGLPTGRHGLSKGEAAPEPIQPEEYFAELVQENFIAEPETPTVIAPSPPCPENMIPIIQNQKVMGCHWSENPIHNPKVQILSSQ